MEYKKETTEKRVMRIVTRVLAIFTGLFILFVVATNPSVFEDLTIDDVTALRGAAMMGFMGWMFVFVFTIRPRK